MATKERYRIKRKLIADARDKMLKCKKCNGDGWILKSLNYKDLGKFEKCKCKEKFELEKMLILANFPNKRIKTVKNDKSFKNRKAKNFLTGKLVEVSSDIVNKYFKGFKKASDSGLGMMFFGKPGTSKTTTALRIIKKLSRKNIDCYYIFFKDMIELLYNSYSNNELKPLYNEIINVDLLVIDEISLIGRITENMIAEFSSVCKQRFENGKPTILISNYISMDEISSNFGMAMESLVREAYVPFNFVGEDIRGSKDDYDYMKKFFE